MGEAGSGEEYVMEKMRTHTIDRLEKDTNSMAIYSEIDGVVHFAANSTHKEDGIMIARAAETGFNTIAFKTAEIDTLISELKSIKEAFLK